MNLTTYLKEHYTKATAEAYGREIGIYLSNYPQAATARYADVVAYVGRLRSRYRKASTLNRMVSSIKVYYDFLCDTDQREDHPAKNLVLRDRRSRDIQLQDLLSPEELSLLLVRRERYSGLDIRNRVLMGLVIYRALLPQEMAALRTDYFNLEAGTVYISPTAKTKARTLALKPDQILPMYNYLQTTRLQLQKGKATSALLIGLRGGAMSAEDITKHIMRTAEAVYGNRKVCAQVIRQSVLKHLLQRGYDISVCRLLRVIKHRRVRKNTGKIPLKHCWRQWNNIILFVNFKTNKKMTIRLRKEQKLPIKGAGDVFTIMQEILLRQQKIDRNREHFWVIGLASDNSILVIELVSMGTKPCACGTDGSVQPGAAEAVCGNHPGTQSSERPA